MRPRTDFCVHVFFAASCRALRPTLSPSPPRSPTRPPPSSRYLRHYHRHLPRYRAEDEPRTNRGRAERERELSTARAEQQPARACRASARTRRARARAVNAESACMLHGETSAEPCGEPSRAVAADPRWPSASHADVRHAMLRLRSRVGASAARASGPRRVRGFVFYPPFHILSLHFIITFSSPTPYKTVYIKHAARVHANTRRCRN